MTDTKIQSLTERYAVKQSIADADQNALAATYRKHVSRVTAVAMSVLRDRDLAADVTQDVFMRLWNNPDRYDPQRGSLGAYLAVDAKGRSIDMLRSRQAAAAREKVDHLERIHEGRAGTEEEAMQRLVGTDVQRVLATLPDDQRVPITLAYFDELSYRAVAEHLSLPEGTVKSRIRSGLRSLKASMPAELAAA